MDKTPARVMTAEDLYRFEILGDLDYSPDGERIVYSQQTVDKNTEKKYTQLWLLETATKKSRQITFGKFNNIQPWFSPDGSQLAFLSNRADSDQYQFYVLPMDGGEAYAISDLQGEIEQFEWSPDGKKLLFQFRKTDPEVLERKKDEKKKELGEVYRHFKRMFYQLDDYGFLPEERWHIWVLDIAKQKALQITDHSVYDEMEPHWAPDGKSIVYFSNRVPDPDMDIDAIDLFRYDLLTGKEEKIETQPGYKQLLSFSPDGSHVAYLGLDGKNADWKNHNLWIVNIHNPADWKNLTKDYDVDLAGSTINDIGSAKNLAPVWSTDMQSLYVQAARHGSTNLINVNRNTGEIQEIINGDGVVSTFRIDRQQKNLVYLYGTMNDPCQIFRKDLRENSSPLQMTKINTWLKQINLGEVEEVWFTGADNNRLQGWIIKPPNFNADKKYPSILEIHGGPLVQYGNFFMHEFYYLAANGYVVYFCNPRGGQGYGEEHAKAIQGSWGGADYADLIAWTDYIDKLPYIDKQHMGVTGGSYGGYMTNWIIGHTQRFQAAVTQRSVSNLISMWGSSDFNWEFQRTFDNHAPFENMDVLWECSPMKHIGNAKTPTLVIHSEKDLRCPFEQGQQVYTALKYLKVDTELIQFPDSPHGLSRTGRTDRRIARLRHILRWFDKYLK